jgi:lipopolysaccharide/colanic/teichoic acid biosynthesis glycosyltransferase
MEVKMVIKRLLDIILSLTAIIVMVPFALIVCILVYTNLGLPILFAQDRIGVRGNVFKMYKFRTMVDAKDEFGNLLPDEKRLTTFGRILRSTSLDEMPELLNVLKGDMSLVGPRPLLVEYLPIYNERQMRRHEVLPGITGWAQINGRNSITWAQKFEFDIWYVENRTLFLDIKILFTTVLKVIMRDGVNQSENVTMERFNGFN